jgi:hypothetical protein
VENVVQPDAVEELDADRSATAAASSAPSSAGSMWVRNGRVTDPKP